MATKAPSTEKRSLLKDKSSRALQRFGNDKRVAVLTIVLFASVGVGGMLFANAAQIKDENTVVLSNGKEIRLNEQVNSLSRKLGKDLVLLNDEQYEYPGPGQPVEVIIDVDRNRVVAIHLANEGNVTLENQNTVGTSLPEVSQRNSKARRAQGKVAQLFPESLSVEKSRSIEYLLADSCDNAEQATAVSIALKGYEERVSQQWNVGECYGD